MLRLGVGLAFAFVGCSDALSSPPPPRDDIDGGAFDGTAVTDGGTPDAAVVLPVTYVRFAQMSPDLGTTDFCLRSRSPDNTVGPLIAPPALDGGPADSGTSGIAFGQVSSYFRVQGSGTMDVVVVSSPAQDCSTARALATVTFGPGQHTTLVAIGVASGGLTPSDGLEVSAFVDESAGDKANVRVRVVNAALGTAERSGPGAVAVDLIAANAIVPLALEAIPRKASTASSTPPIVDDLGYHALDAGLTSKVGARISFAGDAGIAVWTSQSEVIDVELGSVRTAFVISEAYTSGKPSELGMVLCDDLAQGHSMCVALPAY